MFIVKLFITLTKTEFFNTFSFVLIVPVIPAKAGIHYDMKIMLMFKGDVPFNKPCHSALDAESTMLWKKKFL